MRMQQKAEVAASASAVELASCRDVAGSNARWTAKGWMVLTRYPSFVWRGQIVISLVIVIRSLSFPTSHNLGDVLYVRNRKFVVARQSVCRQVQYDPNDNGL